MKMSSQAIRALALIVAGCSLTSTPARAQVNPGVLNPGLQQRQQELQQQQKQLLQLQPGQPKPLIQQEAKPEVDDKDDPQLLINKVEIKGAKVIAIERLEGPFKPLLGQTIRFQQLQKAINEASNIYREEGYFTSRLLLTQGALKDGVLTLQAVEGFIEKVEVVGRGSANLKRWTEQFMAPVVSSAAAPKPIKFAALERQLLALQGVGGIRFSSTMARGKDFSASRVVINLNPQRLSGSAGINNNIQLQLGDYQVVGQLQANALDLGQPLQLDLNGSNAFPYPGGSITGSAGITTPLGNSGLKLALLGAATGTQSTSLLPGLPNTITSGGVSNLASLALRYPLLLSRRATANLSLQADMQNSTNNLYFDGTQVQSSDTRLRVLRLGLDATRSTPSSASYAGLQLSQGLPIWNAQVVSGDPALANPLGSTSFFSARLTLLHQQRIGQTNGFLSFRGMAQLAGTPIPSPEDFSYGGPFLGRAYRSTFLIADQGVAAGLDYSYTFYAGKTTLTPFVFGDFGSLSQQAGSSPQSSQSAASYGIGLRGSFSPNSSFEFGLAIPASVQLGSNIAGRDGPANSIVYFRAGINF